VSSLPDDDSHELLTTTVLAACRKADGKMNFIQLVKPRGVKRMKLEHTVVAAVHKHGQLSYLLTSLKSLASAPALKGKSFVHIGYTGPRRKSV
jgi:hypothetical protein